jgi:DNA-binding MarR family transcriptional regulator
MDSRDLRALQLLEEIERDHTPSQRDLARKLNISLGLVNLFIKRFAQKGYFKITSIPRNRVKYMLTSKGAAEKTRLTYEYIQYSFQSYRGARRKLRGLFKDLVAHGVHRVVFYGASEFAEIAYVALRETSIEMVAVVDDKKSGKKYLGSVVKDPTSLEWLSFDRIFITAVRSTEDVLERILEKGIPRNKVVML